MIDQQHQPDIQNTMNTAPSTHHIPPKVVAGVALIIVGLLILLNSFVQGDSGAIILLAAGLVFLAWGIVARHAGPMIPGGILSGISVGLLLVQQHLFVETDSAGIMTLCLGIGFLIVFPLSMLFSPHPQRWSLLVATSSGKSIGGTRTKGPPELGW